ncbi:TonB family protein [Jiulongibacter sediminis]|uniref:TonB family protein n=1 Tax=Jiulongibacter sediminis TaxID=1605367 RepID=UPI0026EBA85C|nr:TonB family protein [Jiulongibacter sediminis]
MNWFSYLLQVNIYFTISVAFYWLVLRKETFYEINRSFLLGSSLLAFLIPFWKLGIVQDWFVTEQVSEAISVISLEEFSITAGEAQPRWNWNMLWATIYFLGFGYGLLRFSVALFKLQQLLRLHSLEGQAFSVFGKVFIDKKLPDYETIRNHEDIHSRQFHSIDIFWFELVTTVCWFNPVAHVLRKEIKLVHELIADQYASEYAGKKRYAEVLVASHFKAESNILINNFYNHSILKTRIMKLLQEKSKKKALWKYAFAMPLFLGMLVFSAASEASIGDISDNIQEKISGNSTNVFDTISGRVLDNEGNPLAGANVIIRGTTTGTVTDLDGYFKLERIDKNAELVFSFIGYNTSIISVTSVEDLRIILTQAVLTPPPSPTISKREPSGKADGDAFFSVEENPEFPGGTSAMYEFIAKNMKYPEEALEKGLEGRVFVKFVILKDGQIGQREILQGIGGGGTEEEVSRILDIMPKWKPGIQNGKPVNVWFTMPFLFQLDKPGKSTDVIIRDKLVLSPRDSDKPAPIYIVDGKVVENIKELNPDTIKSINVLKGEKAEEHSGEKGKNGVIIIELKKE